ncbi:MAG: TonB-dependent receptor [Lewinellaceae bacterium]|nr:TonB-dependent receptor [Lewinellaceae bacterium]
MKHIFLLLAILAAYKTGTSQILTIRSEESREPLEFATLYSEHPKAFSTTNARGQADVLSFAGAEKIELRLIGYESRTLSFAELEKAGFEVFLSPGSISLGQVVVSATKWEQEGRQTPARVTTISAREIALQNPQTAADLLGSSGQVFIQKSQQGGGSPMIRGFATNRLLIAVDGVRMNTAIFRSGNLQNVISLDPFATERTEVLFGPGSVIYGSDAIGGVMSFYTLTPHLAAGDKTFVKGKGAARYATANEEFSGHADANIGWEKWALVSSFSHNRYGDLRMGSHGPEDYLRPEYVQRIEGEDRVLPNDDASVQKPSGYSQTNLLQKVRFQPNEAWNLTYAFHYSATTDYGRYDRLLRYRNGLPRSAEWRYGPQVWMMNHLSISHKAEEGIYDQFHLNLAHQFFEESRIDRDFNDIERRRRVEKVNAYSANMDFSKALGERHQLLYGLEGVFNDVNSSGTNEDIRAGKTQAGPSRYPQSTWASYAAYFTYQLEATERLLLQAGARYGQFALDAEFDTTFYPFPFTSSNLRDGALTGSLGLVFSPTEEWQLSANASTGFRAPNVDDVGKVFDSEPGAVVVPNPGLGAEYAYNAEVGLARLFNNVLKIDLACFYTILDNALVRRSFTLNGQDSIAYDGELSQVQAVQNAARASVRGIQAGLEAKLPAGFGFSARFNYQNGEEELDDGSTSPLRHAAPWFGVARLKYSANRLRLELNAFFNGEVPYDDMPQEERSKDYLYAADENGNPYSPAWHTLNFRAMYQLTDYFSITAGLENITHQRYRPYSSGLAGAGRNLVLAVRGSF